MIKFELLKKGGLKWNSWGFFDTEEEILIVLKESFGDEFDNCTTEDMYDYLDDWELDVRRILID